MNSQRGKTKIVCTLGPASSSVGMLVDLIQSGVGVVRLNFSHGTQEQHSEALKNVREAVARAGAVVSVLQDLQGPKIRIGKFAGAIVKQALAAANATEVKPQNRKAA